MNPNPSVHRPIILIAAAAMLGIVAGVATAAPRSAISEEAPLDLAQITGESERLILVVGGVFSTREDAAKGAVAVHFGDMAGFYVDSTDNYEIIGVYDQSGPDLVPIACEDIPQTVGSCDPGTIIEAHQPITLEYHGLIPGNIDMLAPDDLACGTLGHPPCVSKRLSALLAGPDGQLERGNFLLLSAFRTLSGAEQFAELARDRGAIITVVRAIKAGDSYVGLGQEAHPDGESGPLLEPLSDPDKYQQ